MSITQKQREELNGMCPAASRVRLGSAVGELETELGTVEGRVEALEQCSGICLRSGTVALTGGTAGLTVVKFGDATAATVTSANAEPYDLAHGETIIVNPDGDGNKTATIAATAATSTSAESPSEDISGGADNKFMISVNGGDAEEVTLTLDGANSGANIATAMQTAIRALDSGQGDEVTVVFSGGKYIITSPVLGTSSSVVVTRAASHNVTEELKIGVADGGVEVAGTGNVANVDAVTAAELAAICNAESGLDGIVATVSADNKLVLTSETTGSSSSLVMGNGTANAAIGFTNTNQFFGAEGLGYDTDMADDEYRVLLTSIHAQASLAGSGVAVVPTTKATSGFTIAAETAADTHSVDVLIHGTAASEE